MKIQVGKSLWFPDCIARVPVEYHVTEVTEFTAKAETDNDVLEKSIEISLENNPKSGHLKAKIWGYTLFCGKTGAQHFLDTHDPFAGYTKEGKETIVSLLMEDSYCKYWLRRCQTGIRLKKNHPAVHGKSFARLYEYRGNKPSLGVGSIHRC